MTEIYKDHKKEGTYKCSKCGYPLFTSSSKFNSGTRWPSFRKGMNDAIVTKDDNSHGMHRIEILCKKCDHHLGHVFDDGKTCGDTDKEAGKRFCVLSDALDFEDVG
jgi:methionine-R-sulfoxide reductase